LLLRYAMTISRRIIKNHVEAFLQGELQPPMLMRLIEFYLRLHTGRWQIRAVDESIIPLIPNESQCRVLAVMMDQAMACEPIRVRVGKARKTGVSTLIECLFADLCAHNKNQQAITIAHEGVQTEVIFNIARCAVERFAYDDDTVCCNADDIIRRAIHFEDTESEFTCQTAGSSGVSAGGTPNLVHITERPKWERNAERTYVSTLNAVPNTHTSIIVDEATFEGRESFWSDFELSYRGSPSTWRSIFIPWYVDSRLSAPCDGLSRTDDELDLSVRALADGVTLTDAMLAWRRLKIAEISPEMFRQEFPSTPEEAVQATKGLILPNPRDCIVHTTPFVYDAVPPECLYGGIDFGYSDTDATVIVSAVLWHSAAYIVGFWRGHSTLAEEQAEGLLPGHLYYYDPSGVQAANQLQRAANVAQRRIRIAAAPRKKAVGEDIGSAELHLLAAWMAKGRLKVKAEVSEQFVLEADSFVWNPRTGKPDDKRASAWGHFDTIFACKYLVMGLDRSAPRLHSSVPEGYKPRRLQFARI
jgi:hypothetical protein